MTLRAGRTIAWLAALLLAGSCAEPPIDPTGETPVDPGQVPPIPVDLVATATQGAITLSWTVADATGVTAYRVYRAAGDEELESMGTPPTPAFRDEQVIPGTDYVYAVASIRAGLEGGRSAPVSARLNEPDLLSPDVTPDFGSQSTTFEYSCIYRHADGLAPSTVTAIVDSIQVFPMSEVGTGTDWVGGELFRATASLPPGGHTFYVTAIASDGSSSRNPIEGFVFGGPVVTQ